MGPVVQSLHLKIIPKARENGQIDVIQRQIAGMWYLQAKKVYSVRKTRRAPSLLLLLNQFQKHLNLCSSLDRIYILANQRREIPVLLEAVLLWWKNYMTLILLCLYVKKMGGYLSFRVPSEYEKRWLRSAQFRLKHVKLTIPNPFKESSP